MAQGCLYTNQHGIQCGLSLGHPGNHELYEQLVMPDPFCIQPWDPNALAAIRCWITCARSHGVPPDKIQKAEVSFNEIKRWQRSHGTRLPG